MNDNGKLTTQEQIDRNGSAISDLFKRVQELENPSVKTVDLDALVMPCHMMATKATHKLGDISREEEDLCYIHEENEENYIGSWITGSWITGFGFVSIEFPKKTTRLLTNNEIKKYNKLAISISGGHAQKLCVGKEA